MIAPHTMIEVTESLLNAAPPALRAWMLSPREIGPYEDENAGRLPRVARALGGGTVRFVDLPLSTIRMMDAYAADQDVAQIMDRAEKLVEDYAAATRRFNKQVPDLAAWANTDKQREALLDLIRTYSAVVEAAGYLRDAYIDLPWVLASMTGNHYKPFALDSRLLRQVSDNRYLEEMAQSLAYYGPRFTGTVLALLTGQPVNVPVWLYRFVSDHPAPATFKRTFTAMHRDLNRQRTAWNDWVDKQGGGNLRFPFGRPRLNVGFHKTNLLPNRRSKEIAGFAVTFTGEVDVPLDWRLRVLSRTEHMLEVYRERCERYFPRLSTRLTPHLDVWLFKPFGKRTPGGHYYSTGRGIGLYPDGYPYFYNEEATRGHLNTVVQTIAHEAGHHIWKTVLLPEQRELWEKLVTQKVPLDYALLLRAFDEASAEATQGGARAPRMVQDTFPYMREHYPELYLQVLIASSVYDPDYTKTKDGVPWRWSSEPLHHYTRADIAARVEGTARKRHVPALPITMYAATNPEESWCDAFGNLIAYGPHTVLEPIRALIYSFFPDIRRNPDDGEDVLPALAADT